MCSINTGMKALARCRLFVYSYLLLPKPFQEIRVLNGKVLAPCYLAVALNDIQGILGGIKVVW